MKINRTIYPKFLFLLILSYSISSCKRYSNEESQELISEKISITKPEVQKILNLKLNLINFSEPSKYSISVSENYTPTVMGVYSQGDIDLQFGKLNLKSKKETIAIQLTSALMPDERLCDQIIYIVKDDNPNLISISAIKKGFPEDEFVYYEDSNSIVYGDDFKTVHFEYDTTIKSYIIYTGEISHFVNIPEKEKINLAIHMLKNGKNLLKKACQNISFDSWQDYVANTPQAEITVFKSIFYKLEKEMKAFLGENQSVSPRSQGNYNYVDFYRANEEMDFAYLNFLTAIKTNNVSNFNLSHKIPDDFDRTFFDHEAANNFSYSQIDSVTDLKIVKPEYEWIEEKLVCHVNYQRKSFYLTTDKFSAVTKDFYIKMFNYYSKYKTLDIPTLKN
jgi:hypothetical protein